MLIDIKKILQNITYFEYIKNKNIKINSISDLESNINSSISWCSENNIHKIKFISNKIIIVPTSSVGLEILLNNKRNNYIFTDNPRVFFSKLLLLIYPDEINDTPLLESNVFIGENVKMGKNVKIGHNTVIYDNTVIGNNVNIGCNNTIGGVGFGYEKDESGNYILIKHIGNVVIHDNVDIGNNICIDRAVLGSTIIGNNVKIDNLVHIAHGVKIGENSLIIANSMIAGSTNIGKNVWIAPSTSIINKVNIGDNSMTGIGSVVIGKIYDNELHVGVPSKKIKNI
jgi:UDP-3-O-[3-hydroxymyristoyl] glucosamine N-acyltransferase